MAGNVTAQYGAWAATYDEDKLKLFEKYGMNYDDFMTKLGIECELFPGIKIIDIGAGTGLTSISLAKTLSGECSITAVDPVPEMLEQAKVNYAKEELTDRVTILLGKGEEIPAPDNAFDLLVSTFALRHMDYKQALKEFARVLKPGGRLVVAESCAPPSWRTTLGKVVMGLAKVILSLKKKYRSELKATVLTEEEWRAALTKVGFTDIKLAEVEGKKNSEFDLYKLLMSARLG